MSVTVEVRIGCRRDAAPLVEWSTQHLPQIDAARARYDQRTRRQPVSP
jgi:hypothetical protein